jgi:hypothetical protein
VRDRRRRGSRKGTGMARGAERYGEEGKGKKGKGRRESAWGYTPSNSHPCPRPWAELGYDMENQQACAVVRRGESVNQAICVWLANAISYDDLSQTWQSLHEMMARKNVGINISVCMHAAK